MNQGFLEHTIIEEYDSLDSTQSEARRLCDMGRLHHGTCIFTPNQTNGRGRYDRKWESGSGNVALTIALLPDKPLNMWMQLCYLSAIAVNNAICYFDQYTAISFKWVNDIMLRGQKLSGILLETHGRFLLVGIGVNLQHFDKLKNFRATSLEEAGLPGIKPREFVKVLVRQFKELYNEWCSRGFSIVKNQWIRQAQDLGKYIKVNLPEGKVKEGIFLGIDDEGRLELMVKSELELIEVGELFNG